MAAKKEFFIRVKDELVEVTQEVYLTYYRGKRGEETQLEKMCIRDRLRETLQSMILWFQGQNLIPPAR